MDDVPQKVAQQHRDTLAARQQLEQLYVEHLHSGAAIAPHLEKIRLYASDNCRLAVEFGVKRGGSTCALLLGARAVLSVDLVQTPQVTQLKRLAGIRWTFLQGDSRDVTIPACDLLLLDANHTYASVKAELTKHADRVGRYLIFHDTLTFGSIGANGESGVPLWAPQPGISVPEHALGICPAIFELMMHDRSWHVVYTSWKSHGLLVLERW